MPIVNLTDARLRGTTPPQPDASNSGMANPILLSRHGGGRSHLDLSLPTGQRCCLPPRDAGPLPSPSPSPMPASLPKRIRAQVRTDDPQQDRRDDREAHRAAQTFDALCDLYLDHARRHKSSWKNDEGYLRANARPLWGERAAATITRPDVAKLLLDVVGRSPTSANRLRSILVTMFTWAVDNSLLDVSPMVGIKKPAKEGQGKTRTLRDDELRVFWTALDDAGLTPPISAALRIILLLGQRPAEVAGMTRDELIDFDAPDAALWALPADRMKARRPHVVPLPALARAIIQGELTRQREAAGVEVEFVFASRLPTANGWRGTRSRRRCGA